MAGDSIYDDELLKEILNFDPIDAAGRTTGSSDPGLSLLLHLQSVSATKTAMEKTNDSHYSISMANYLEIIQDIGFEVVISDNFSVQDKYTSDPPRTETWYILYHRKYGALMFATTYRGDTLNCSKVWYNWKPNTEDYWDFISSGGFVTPENPDEKCTIWCGDHDGREAVRFNLRRLAENGEFLTQWVEQPHLWFVTYGDEQVINDMYKDDWPLKSEAYRRVTKEKLALLPKDILALVDVPSRYEKHD